MLCQLAGDKGEVFSFDIQEKAIQKTQELLIEHECMERVRLIQEADGMNGDIIEKKDYL